MQLKKLNFIFVFLCSFCLSMEAQSGKCGEFLKWEINKEGTLTITGLGALKEYPWKKYNDRIKNVVIDNTVYEIGWYAFQFLPNVTECDLILPKHLKKIGSHAFEGSAFRSITIPNTVRQVGDEVFAKCWNLEKLIVPDDSFTIKSSYNSEFGHEIFFKGCSRLREVKCNNGKFPGYLVPVLKYLPFFAEKSFSFYVSSRYDNQIRKWLTKDEFETTEQWSQRTSDSERLKYTKIVTDSLVRSFFKDKDVQIGKAHLGTYDTRTKTFPVQFDNGIKLLVNVPLAEAPDFKKEWSKVKLQPQYEVVADTAALNACAFSVNGKTFNSTGYSPVQSYSNLVNLSTVDMGNASNISSNNRSDNAVESFNNDVDINIPVKTVADKKYAFAVIIGNENYQRVAKVEFAKNDAKVFGEYCNKTLGIPESNIRSYTDATYGTMKAALNDLQNLATAFNGGIDVIFYYAGHGIPNEKDQSAYLLPVDADGTQTDVCLSTKTLYETLGNLNARHVVVLMDACFSGAQRGDGMLAAARGVALKTKEDKLSGNMVVITAASGDQTAYPYKEKGHGMFTYFLLKKLQEDKNLYIHLGDIYDYISENVAKQSVIINKHLQTPTLSTSEAVANKWRDMYLQ